jgi:hypothetical protein
MSFRTELSRLIRRQIASWRLTDPVFVEVYLRLNERMPTTAANLERLREPFDSMGYPFQFIDPGNRLREHLFLFAVRFGTDEETIHVVRGMHVCCTV